MIEQAPHRAGMLDAAARLVESSGLAVLDRDWNDCGCQLDLVAAAGRTLVVAEVTADPLEVVHSEAGEAADRFRELVWAAATWMRDHDRRFAVLQIWSVVTGSDGSGEIIRWVPGGHRCDG